MCVYITYIYVCTFLRDQEEVCNIIDVARRVENRTGFEWSLALMAIVEELLEQNGHVDEECSARCRCKKCLNV